MGLCYSSVPTGKLSPQITVHFGTCSRTATAAIPLPVRSTRKKSSSGAVR